MALTRSGNNNGMITLFTVLYLLTIVANAGAAWLNHGGDLSNRRYAPTELVINRLSVSRLRLKWSFYAGKDITATPAIFGGKVYFPSWNGHIYAVNALDGSLAWDKNLGELTNLTSTGVVVNVTVSRATPTITGNLLIVGIYGPAVVIALNRFTGDLVWKTQLDNRFRALITMSGTELNGYFYVGVSSLEEGLSPAQCCTFRGSMVKLNARTGALVWQTYTVPDNGGKLGGYSGAAIWGSSPSIDTRRNLVYVTTGNLYTAPPEVLKCQDEQNNQTVPTHPDRCIQPDTHFNSILAFDTETGKIRWSRQLGGYDVWYFGCLTPSSPNCPPGPNIDADFGESPMLLSIIVNGTARDAVVAVQKSGYAWALDSTNGDIIWSTVAGPGGTEGGGTWGASTDGRRVYTNIVNNNRVSFQLAPTNQTTNAGAWVALDANTGKIIWSTSNPSNDTSNGPVTLVNNVLFAGSVAPHGPIYAMDAQTGNILWSFDTGATVYGGVSTSYGCIFLGNGYTVGLAKFKPTWTPGTSLHAFCFL
ncbi:hypothetical protein AQUCO_07400035v1 [Aquilegia coerulea]|uniref:Pyrrolo-quinoline quinone repeat domain-containing protein n=1 Tax=Aquilegia coerulea TaxID=218851 RepID=A0A2G5C9I7_AQUCA|nr:hypothetical protein AQUCO_07400035v1 [Aquilegia coerulea]